MYTHEPENYHCPLCVAVKKEEKEYSFIKPSDIVYQDELLTAFIASFVFTDSKPYVILIPNKHSENIYTMDTSSLHAIMDMAQKVALAYKAVYNAEGVSLHQHNEPAGNQDVWHYHLHVIPRFTNDKIYQKIANLDRAILPPEERKPFADKLRKELER